MCFGPCANSVLVRVCHYCGKSNEQATQFCLGCGTPLDAEERKPTSPHRKAAALRSLMRDLNAISATVIFSAYLLAEIFWVACAVVIAFAVVHKHGAQDGDQFFGVLSRFMPATVVLSPISGGIATVLMSLALVPKSVKDTSPNGACWVLGSWKAIAQGCLVGLLIAACAYLVTQVARHHTDYRNIDPLARMALKPGVFRVLAMVVAIVIGPITEEILFRGVLFGGFRKSFGPIWAPLLTTALFVLLHVPKVFYSMPALVGMIVQALAALRYRLSSKAIGPAIAVHIGHNAMIAMIFLWKTWRL
jgi:membrane protease YdiL (CAAX protease family)